MIEDETGAPLDIKSASAPASTQGASARPGEAGPEETTSNGAGTEAKLIARDDKKKPLISTFDWTNEAAQRIFRVPAGFMRNKTQERVEELARERAASSIDLALVEDGIEIGKKMMAEMIATYTAPPPATARGSRDDGARRSAKATTRSAHVTAGWPHLSAVEIGRASA